ncbi:MAG: M17 family peptidase N-terminal domain-containing protein, partial [Opitutaceae bacterium]
LYPFLKKLALLDLAHSAEELGGKILSTFPGLMEMMPQRSKFTGLDLYDLAEWPINGGRPHPDVLPQVAAAQQKFGIDAKRFVMIAGVNKETTTGVSRVGGEFIFERSNAGDGTVPLDFALLPDVLTYYYEEEHGAMPKNQTLHRAMTDIIKDGSTSALPAEWQRSRSEWKRRVAESDLRQELDAATQRTRGNITAADLRSIMEEFAAPTTVDVAAELAVAPGARVAPAVGHVRNAIVIGRRTQRRVEVRLARGSLTQVRSRAYVLGAFQGVDPSGAASAVDQLMNGAITEFRQRRMFSHSVGELIMLPASWHDVRTDHVVFAGLGPIDRFNAQVLQTAAENVARSMVRANIEEFATVLIGAGTGIDIPTALEALLSGFFVGLNDADENQSFRAITFCEMDAARYALLRSSLLQLSTMDVCDGTEFTFIDLPPPPPEPVSASRMRLAPALPPSVYLHVRGERDGANGPLTLEASLLTSGPKATVLPGRIVVSEPKLHAQLNLIETQRFRHALLPQFGRDLAALVLPDSIATALKKYLDHHLVIVHDAEASRIPWEVLCLDGEFPALKGGISRRYVAEQLAVAKWLEVRREDEVLD